MVQMDLADRMIRNFYQKMILSLLQRVFQKLSKALTKTKVNSRKSPIALA